MDERPKSQISDTESSSEPTPSGSSSSVTESNKETSSSDAAQPTSTRTPGSGNTTEPKTDPPNTSYATRPRGVPMLRGRTTSIPRSVGNKTPSRSSRTPKSDGSKPPTGDDPKSGGRITPKSGRSTSSNISPALGSNKKASGNTSTGKNLSEKSAAIKNRENNPKATKQDKPIRRWNASTYVPRSHPIPSLSSSFRPKRAASSGVGKTTQSTQKTSNQEADSTKPCSSTFPGRDGDTVSPTSSTLPRVSSDTGSFSSNTLSSVNTETTSLSSSMRSSVVSDAVPASVDSDAMPASLGTDAMPASLGTDAVPLLASSDATYGDSVRDTTDYSLPLLGDASTAQGSLSLGTSKDTESSSGRNDTTSPSRSDSESTSTETGHVYGVRAPKRTDDYGAVSVRTMSCISSIRTDSMDSQSGPVARSDNEIDNTNDETTMRIDSIPNQENRVKVGVVGSKGVGRNTLASRFMKSLNVNRFYERRNDYMEVVVIPTHQEDEGPPASWWTKPPNGVQHELWSSLNVIIFMYAVDDIFSHEMMCDTWVRWVRSLNLENPNVIVVGNKVDVVDPNYSKMRRVQRSTVTNAQGVESARAMGYPCYLECSAATMKGVGMIEQTIFDMTGHYSYNEWRILSQTDNGSSITIGVLGPPDCGRNRLASAICLIEYEISYEKTNSLLIEDKSQTLSVIVIPTHEKDPGDHLWYLENYLLIILLYKTHYPQTLVDMIDLESSFRKIMKDKRRDLPDFYLVGNSDIDENLKNRGEPVSWTFLQRIAPLFGFSRLFECGVRNCNGVDKIRTAIEVDRKDWC